MKRSKQHLMKRTARAYLNDLNPGKTATVKSFIYFCHDVMQYYVDLFWQRQDFSGKLADLPTVHKAKNRFKTTTRLCQALAKQAKEIVRSQHKKERKRQPRLRYHTVTLFYHFVTIERFNQTGFDWAVKLIGSGAPRLVIPIPSTKLINQRIADGWQMSKTIRMGIRGDGRLWIDFIFEKERPKLKDEGKIVGMDSNYKNGLVFSDGQTTGDAIYKRTIEFAKRQKHTRAEVKSMIGAALKQIDFSQIKAIVVEDLKKVKSGTRGTFSQGHAVWGNPRRVRCPRRFNRRLSHWLYKYSETLLERKCEELGIEVIRKNPWKTSQFCRHCFKWDRRNRRGDKFLCVNCHHGVEHADFNASKNLELLGLLGFYGIHDLQSSKCQSFE